MKKTYIYNDDLINELNVKTGYNNYITDISKIEDGSTVFYVPNKIENYSKQSDYLEELSNKDDKVKYMKNNHIFYNYYKKYNYFSVIESEQKLFKILKEDKKNINIINVEEIIISKLDTSKLIKSELIDNIFVFKMIDGDNLLVSFVYQNSFVLNDIKKITDIELINYLLDLKRRKEKIQKKLFLSVNEENDELKKVFIEDQEEYDSNINNDEVKKIFKKPIFYNKIDNINILDENFKSSELILVNNVYNKIKSKKRKELLLYSLNIFVSALIMMFLMFPYKDSVIKISKDENNKLKRELSKITEKYKNEGISKLNDSKIKSNREWKNAPLLISYIKNIGLGINNSTILNQEEGTYIQVITTGTIPESVIKKLKNEVQLIEIKKIPGENDFSSGEVNALIFDLEEMDKNVFKMEIK